MESLDLTSVIKRFEKGFRQIEKEFENLSIKEKEVLTLNEVANYTGLSKGYLYKLTMRQEIPHYKPNGKCLYFDRVEIEKWLKSNRIATQEELAQQAQTYCMKGGRK